MDPSQQSSTYGLVGLPSNVVYPAAKFLHAQSSYSSAVSCQFCFSIIFSIISTAIWKNHNMTNLVTQMTGGATIEGDVGQAVWLSEYGWAVSLGLFCAWCCVGAAIVGIARHCVDSRNTGGLCFCAVLEGLCACCSCSSCIGLLLKTIFMASFAAFLGAQTGQEAMCTQILNAGTNPELATTTVSPANPQFENCLAFAEGMRAILILFAVQLGCLVCLEMQVCSSCAGGAKFAHETKEAIEDAEGGFAQDYY